ncbi:MAG: putative Ig domain-containing protein [Luteolibacter sp.]
MAASLRSRSRRIALQLLPFFLAIPLANAQQPADWMSGQWGIGWRFNADNKADIANWDVATTVNQVKAIPGVTYVLFNLSDAAHGDAYIAPHSVLTAITPAATPNNDRDLFLEMATAFQAEGIKVIAYVATQGPAMLKHGAEKAFDRVETSPGSGVWTSQAMDNWEAYVLSEYGNTTVETYKQAFAEVIIDEYAARYGTLIDGWWFDHSGVGNIPLLHDTVTAYNPNVVIAFNEGQKIPLTNNNPDYEDYTFGHPTPVASAPASTQQNLPMLTSIEATPDGFFDDAGRKSLGHMFMPMGETWNSGAIVWSVAQAADWQERCIKAGGAWTWNVDVAPSSSSLRADTVTFMNDVIAEMAQPNTAPVFSQSNIGGGTVTMNTAYSGSLASLATDADAHTLNFVKVTGPDWLNVADDGTLSGTPDNFAVGMNRFLIVVSDGHGDIDLAELEIYVQNDLGNGKAYLNLSFSDLRPNLSAGSIYGLGVSDPNVSMTVAADGNDAVMSLSITNQNFDGIGGNNDTLSWDVRIKGYTGGSYTLNGNNSAAQLGTSVPVGTIDNEFGVSGTDLRFVDDRESIQYSVENVVLISDAIATAQFEGFDELWGTTGTYILGNGPSGLESKTLAANGELPLSPATVLTLTSTGKERLRDPGGDFTIYPNNAPYFVASSIQVNGEEGIAYSDTLTNLSATATDPDGEPLIYSKAAGPAWLSVASDGTLSGTPGAADVGLNTFTIRVEDPWNAADSLIVEISVDPSTPPAAPTGVSALANIGSVDLDWSDNSESDLDSYTVYRSTTSGSGYTAIASGLTSSDYTDNSVTNHTSYYYVVSASNIHNRESAMSNEVSAYPGYVPSVVDSEVAVLGSVSGAFNNMDASDNTYQSITEVVNGSTSALEHKWVFTVANAELATFYVEAYRSANAEGDDMVFAYSTDDLNYIDMVTVTKTADDDTAQYYALPSGTSGTVYVRLIDADRAGGNTQLDSISIDQLLIIAEESTVAPSIATAPSPADAAIDVDVNALLSWTAGHQSGSHDVYFGTSTSPAFQGNQSDTSFDPGVLADNTTYYWAVDEVNNSGTTPGNLWSFTTAAAPSSWTVLTSDDFENGFGNWTDGGSDARLSSSFAVGSQCLALQDNSSSSVSELANALDLTGYNELKVEFSYVVQSFEGSEDFWLRYSSDGGASWSTIVALVNDVDFVDDGTRYYLSIPINSTGHAFTNNVKLMFQCNASGNGDDVYIDDVVISAQ